MPRVVEMQIMNRKTQNEVVEKDFLLDYNKLLEKMKRRNGWFKNEKLLVF